MTAYEPLVEVFCPPGAAPPGGRGAGATALAHPADVLQMATSPPHELHK